MKQLLAVCFALAAFNFTSNAQCNPPAGVTLINTQPCGICFTLFEYDPMCNPCPAVTICVPPGGVVFVPPACGGSIEGAMVSDVPPPFPPAPCSALGNAPWACCIPPGPPVVPWMMCSPCGGGAPVMMTWGGGPGAPTITI